MKRFLPIIFICAAIVSACTNEKISTSKVQEAKSFFENNATALSLPNIGNVPTKADISSVYPDWDNGILSKTESGDVFEFPLLGSCKFAGVLIEGSVEDKTIVKANVSSYLVIDYRNAAEKPQMYVETIIDKGHKAKTHLLSDKRKNDCVVMLSSLSGEIYDVNGYTGDISLPLKETSKGAHSNPNHSVFGYRLAYMVETKSSDCSYYGWHFCFICNKASIIYLMDGDFCCPHCGTPYVEDIEEYCTRCGHIWYECECENPDKEKMCPLCGLWQPGCADENCGCGCQDH